MIQESSMCCSAEVCDVFGAEPNSAMSWQHWHCKLLHVPSLTIFFFYCLPYSIFDLEPWPSDSCRKHVLANRLEQIEGFSGVCHQVWVVHQLLPGEAWNYLSVTEDKESHCLRCWERLQNIAFEPLIFDLFTITQRWHMYPTLLMFAIFFHQFDIPAGWSKTCSQSR